ncbi:HAMP domain-containing sensor histidine kinase [Paracoccaceae bacterium Fryx2]|nr:HAMP domain-containing sensor histidine kinase [Paracoccaceae bacterium Fryx2]
MPPDPQPAPPPAPQPIPQPAASQVPAPVPAPAPHLPLRRLLAASPVRLALGLVLVFSLTSLVTLGGAYLSIRSSLESGLAANVAQNIAGFRAAPSALAVATLVEAEASATDVADRIFSYTTADGRSFGNARAEPEAGGIVLRPAAGGRTLAPAGYLHEAVPLHGGLLVVAESRAAIAELGDVFAALLGLSLLPTTLVALGAGLALSRRAARRVARIEAALDALTAGDLAARVGGSADRADDLDRIGTRIDRMAAAQEASVSALRQVSADIAHDLKTPVQRIALLLGQLRDGLDPGSAAALLATRAEAEADRAVAVFQSLLTIAQIEGGSPRARFAPVDLGALLATFAEIYAPAAEDSGHLLHLCPLPDRPLPVPGDRSLLGQIIANLIENALRHTPPGTRITLALGQDGGRATLSVCDNGPGIPAEERDQVLRRLYRLERSRTTPGHGLGLSLVAAISALHRADLTLSDAAPGLCVRVAFPAAGDESSPRGGAGAVTSRPTPAALSP